MIKIGIADDHSIFLDSLSNLLNSVSNFKVTITANNGQELLDSCRDNGVPNVILLDLSMPIMDGFETCKELNNQYADCKVIALTMHKEKSYIARMIRNGVSGYLLKDAQVEEVIDAINKAANGGLPFNNEAIDVMRNIYKDNDGKIASINDFSSRELEIIDCVCREYTNPEIAQNLFISESTVANHKKSIFKKMKVKNTIGMAVYAVMHGLVDI